MQRISSIHDTIPIRNSTPKPPLNSTSDVPVRSLSKEEREETRKDILCLNELLKSMRSFDFSDQQQTVPMFVISLMGKLKIKMESL